MSILHCYLIDQYQSFQFALQLPSRIRMYSIADCAYFLSQRTKKAPLNPLATLDPGIVNPGAVEPAALK